MSVAARGASRKPKRISHLIRPEDVSLADWQIALRRQVAVEATLEMKNLGAAPVFSEFSIRNPATKRSYRVAIRGESPGDNFCTCPDYAVNTLGTCKHIEFVLARLRERHAATLRRGHLPAYSEVYLRYGERRSIRFAGGSDCPPALRKLADACFDADGGPRSDERLNRFIEEAPALCAAANHELRFYDDAQGFIAERRDRRRRESQLKKLYIGAGAAARWDRLLKAKLFPYQREGALFAATAGRALIADDMGLGKTIQAIAAAEILARHCGVERVLVVCPASLKHQWKAEIEKFSGRDAVIIAGLTHERERAYRDPAGFFKIVNYDVIHRDVDAIAAWRPDLVVLDEAQRIKNWQTRAAQAVKRIESPYAVVLTGTPLENRLEELHSIVEFVDRHRLGPLFAFRAAHEMKEEGSTRVVGYRDLGRVTATLASIMIRRTKKAVLSQLPPRSDKNYFVPMTPEQWVIHHENRDTVALLVAKWRRFRFLSEADQLRLRIALQYMRMSCDSTYLVDHTTRCGVKVEELRRVLDEVLQQPEQKVVIFSQWLRMNELVVEMLAERGWGHVEFHGGVHSNERNERVKAFREDDGCRIFLSTDAGGVGLNLQSASCVVNMDLPWNPAVLEQRIGRAHRLGQKSPVRVVNFVAEGTIEHGMLSLLKFKKSLFAGVLDGSADQVAMGEGAMSRFVKTIETATSSIPPAETVDTATAAAGAQTAPAEAAAPPPIDAVTTPARDSAVVASASAATAPLGQLLGQAATVLAEIGRALSTPATDESPVVDWPMVRIVSDARTQRRELRVPIADEAAVARWAALLGQALGALTPPNARQGNA